MLSLFFFATNSRIIFLRSPDSYRDADLFFRPQIKRIFTDFSKLFEPIFLPRIHQLFFHADFADYFFATD